MRKCKCVIKVNENAKSVDIVDAYRSMLINCTCEVKQ
jgi:hypothetical protein